MSKRTLSNKTKYSILKLSGFRNRMSNPKGRKIIKNRRKKGRYKLTIQHK
jgi:large subunit ribosomal protein L34